MSTLKLATRARLRVDRRTGEALLLWPERGLSLGRTAVRIVELLDGTRDIDGVIDVLAAEHPAAARARVAADVRAFIAALRSRALVVEG